VIGTSTGGPQALARRLDDKSKLTVVEAETGMAMEPGLVILAKGGQHLRLVRQGNKVTAAVDRHPLESIYHPSVNELFTSAAVAYGAGALGVVMTGMGDDGLIGTRAMVERGGRVLTESEGSCVVYGMPRAVKDAGLSTSEARLEDMADEITRRL